MTIRHLIGDTEWAVGYVCLLFRGQDRDIDVNLGAISIYVGLQAMKSDKVT